jgi:hypothetical protein
VAEDCLHVRRGNARAEQPHCRRVAKIMQVQLALIGRKVAQRNTVALRWPSAILLGCEISANMFNKWSVVTICNIRAEIR